MMNDSKMLHKTKATYKAAATWLPNFRNFVPNKITTVLAIEFVVRIFRSHWKRSFMFEDLLWNYWLLISSFLSYSMQIELTGKVDKYRNYLLKLYLEKCTV